MVVMKVLMNVFEAYCIRRQVLPTPRGMLENTPDSRNTPTRVSNHKQLNLHIKVLLVSSHGNYIYMNIDLKT